jgi:hypothetical protein
MVSAEGGSAFFGNVGINTDNIDNALTVVGNISATGTHVFEVSSTNPALRINQTGTGHALVVEDSTNPDSTPFIITEDGTTLIGVSGNPSIGSNNKLFIGGNTTSQNIALGISVAAEGASLGPVLNFTKTRGTLYSPLSVQQNHTLGTINWVGENNSFWSGASIRAVVDENPNPSSMPARLEFSTSGNSIFNSAVRMTIKSNGNVGIGTTTPNEKLTVSGNISATGTFVLDTSSSNTAFRITQRGEGNILTVEDVEHPDFSPFNIDKDGRVITGSVSTYDVITAPGFRLRPFFQNIGIPSTGGGAGQRSGNLIFRASANNSPGYLHLAKARTVLLDSNILSAVQVGDSLGRISYNGYDGTDIIESSYTEAIVSSVVPGASSVSSHIVFNTSNSGVFSLPASERMRITADGNVGIGTTTPNEILTVSGNISASGTVYGSPISLLGFHASTNPSVLSPNWATLHFAYPNDLAAITTSAERGFKFPFNARIVAAALTVSVGGTLGAGMVDGSSLNILNKTTSTRTTLLSAQTYSSSFSTYNTDNLSINVDKNQDYTFQVVIPAHATPPTTVRHTVNIYFIRI